MTIVDVKADMRLDYEALIREYSAAAREADENYVVYEVGPYSVLVSARSDSACSKSAGAMRSEVSASSIKRIVSRSAQESSSSQSRGRSRPGPPTTLSPARAWRRRPQSGVPAQARHTVVSVNPC